MSWRVAILPYLGQQELYNKFHLDESWDSPHNKTLLDQMPDVYAPTIHKDKSEHSTYYQVFYGFGTIFGNELGDLGMKPKDIRDGTSTTLMIVEADRPVPWTKPESLPFDPDKPLPELGGQHKDGFCASFANGSVRCIKRTIDPQVLKALITANGRETIALDRIPN